MKNLSIAQIIDKNKLASDQAWLVALNIDVRNPVTGNIDDNIRVVRNDEVVTIDGEIYEPMPFEITFEEVADGMPSMNIVIQDQTGIVQGFMQGYAGGVGFPVTVIAVTGTNKNALKSEADLMEFFEITNGSADSGNYTVTWELGVENPLSISFPRRRQYTDQCSFRFKGLECGYTGSVATCDFTIGGDNGCRSKFNTARFGGFPGLMQRG